MRKFVAGNTPDPDQPKYQRSPLAWQRDMADFVTRMFQQLEQVSAQANSPLGQNYDKPTSFTTNTTISGTSTGTDVANFLCSLVQSFQDKGIINPAKGAS